MGRRLAAQRLSDPLGGFAGQFGNGGTGIESGVRRDQHIVTVEQRMVGRWRLLTENIQRGAGQPAIVKRLDQRVFINNRPARSVDQIGGRFHVAEGPLIEEMAGGRGQRRVDRNVVGFLEQKVEILGGNVGRREGVNGKARGIGDDAQAKPPRFSNYKYEIGRENTDNGSNIQGKR